MSHSPNPSIQVPDHPAHAALEQAARFADEANSPAEFFTQILTLMRGALSAPAAAAWLPTPEGHFSPVSQSGIEAVASRLSPAARECHDSFLRQAVERGQPVSFSPHSKTNGTAGDTPIHPLLFVPILSDKDRLGILEAWLPPEADPLAVQTGIRLLAQLTAIAARFLRNWAQRQSIDRQELWIQLEAFDVSVHSSLHPTEVAFVVVNEGRRLMGVDRVSVAVRPGYHVRIEAVSGTDVVERRSNVVRRLRTLCECVLDKGERLVFTGMRNESLPPDILETLDAYLEEASPRFLIVEPLRDKRDVALDTLPRSALVLECLEPARDPEALIGRLEVVGRHAAPALYNALEHHQIPLRLLWWPMLRLQKGLGGKARAISILSVLALVLLIAALIWVPYPLKMDATGQLMPQERCWVYAPVEGQVVDFAPGVVPGASVVEGQSLVLMHDVQLQLKVVQLQGEIAAAQHDAETLAAQYNAATMENDRQSIAGERKKKEYLRDRKSKELQALRERTHAVEGRPGYFWLTAPMSGTILNGDFRENLTHRQVKPSDPLLRIGDKSRSWEIELKIPHKHLGQVLLALDREHPDTELDVDLLLTGHPTRSYKGKLAFAKVGGEAAANKDDPAETEPVLMAWVRFDGPGIAPEEQIPADLLLAGAEVHAKIRCGDRRLGYALFYGVWEFLYEKVVFWF